MSGRDVSWTTIAPGIRRMDRPRGPWFQYVDPVGYEWNIHEIAIPALPRSMSGYRILHVSDLHAWPEWLTSYDNLIDRIAAEVPDLLLLTGDYVEEIETPRRSMTTVNRFLSGLKARDGVFGIFGNHDELLTEKDFDGSNVRFIRGEQTIVETPRGRIELIGMPGQERADLDLAWVKSLSSKTRGVPRVVLSHYPDQIRRLRTLRADLQLSGHTHGGQVNFPFRIPFIRHDSLPIGQFQGVHRIGPTCLVVNRGFGFSTAGLRVFCPAEVVEIRLVPADWSS